MEVSFLGGRPVFGFFLPLLFCILLFMFDADVCCRVLFLLCVSCSSNVGFISVLCDGFHVWFCAAKYVCYFCIITLLYLANQYAIENIEMDKYLLWFTVCSKLLQRLYTWISTRVHCV
jgi:hypothetical protein